MPFLTNLRLFVSDSNTCFRQFHTDIRCKSYFVGLHVCGLSQCLSFLSRHFNTNTFLIIENLNFYTSNLFKLVVDHKVGKRVTDSVSLGVIL